MKKKSLYISDFRLFDWDHFLIVKGIAILLVVLAKIFEHFYANDVLEPLRGFAASVFLICSGYGISESHRSKNGLPHYWENKVIKLWIPSLVMLVAASVIQGGGIVAWIESYPTALYGWFMYLLFGEYAAFWLMFRFASNKTTRVIGLFVISAIALFFVPEQNIILQVFGFPIGVWISQFKVKYTLRSMHWMKKLLLSLALLVLAVGCTLLMGSVTQRYPAMAVYTIAYLCGAAFLILGTYYARVLKFWGIFAPFGLMSYGLFLLHGIVLNIFGKNNQWRTVLISLALLVVIAGLYSWAIDLFASWNKYMRRRKQTRLRGSIW